MQKILILFLFLLSTDVFPYKAVMYNGSNSQPWEKLIAKTLAGIVNRDSSRLYLMNVYETWSFSRTDEAWGEIYINRGGVSFDTVKNISVLIEKFRRYIKGGISYDPNQFYSNFAYQNLMWQGEYAALIGALTDRLPVTVNQAAAFSLSLDDSVLIRDSFDGDPDIFVTGRLENVVNPWNSVSLTDEQKYLAITAWGIKNLLPRCNPNKLYIRELTDYTVQKKMFQVNLAGKDPYSAKFESLPAARADLLEMVLQYLHSKNPNNIFHIYGWMTPEPVIQWFAFFGASFHETLLGNISWHSSFPVQNKNVRRASEISPDTLKIADKYYLLFLGTEGDAGNWNIGFQAGAWLSKDRGKTAVGWGWNLELLHECQFISQYYMETATINDGFVSVTSPLGYAYPDLWPESVWQNAVDSSKFLMNKFKVNNIYAYKHYANGAYTYNYRGKELNNSYDFTRLGKFASETDAGTVFLFDPKLQTQTAYRSFGGLLFNHVNDGTFYGDVNNLNTASARIIQTLKTWSKPSFMLAGYQRLRQDDFLNRTAPENADISMERLSILVNTIKSDPEIGKDVAVVTPEIFSALLKMKHQTKVAEYAQFVPGEFRLNQNYPNPFNPVTSITYEIPRKCSVEIKIFDILGKEITALFIGERNAGVYKVNFEASSLSSGIYICRMKTADAVKSIKMILAK